MEHKEDFYPRSPCGERLRCNLTLFAYSLFLSTFPLRGTSSDLDCIYRGNIYNFYPRSPCGERPDAGKTAPVLPLFLSTFPLRGTSQKNYDGLVDRQISIHVPLAGNVRESQPKHIPNPYFYPRSPCGERLVIQNTNRFSQTFLSTFPLRGTSSHRRQMPGQPPYFYPRSPCGERLPIYLLFHRREDISIHVPLAGNV